MPWLYWLGGLGLALLLNVVSNDVGDWLAWLANRLVSTAATWRYHDRPERAAIRREEFAAILEARPGNLLKLATAIGFAASATPKIVIVKLRRTRLGRRRNKALVDKNSSGWVDMMLQEQVAIHWSRRRQFRKQQRELDELQALLTIGEQMYAQIRADERDRHPERPSS